MGGAKTSSDRTAKVSPRCARPQPQKTPTPRRSTNVLMRGIVLRSEALGSHFLCPSCRRYITGERGLVPLRDPALRPRRVITTARKAAVEPEQPPAKPRVRFEPPRNKERFAQSRVSRPSQTTNVLEGGPQKPEQKEPRSAEARHGDQELDSRTATFHKILKDGHPEVVMNALLDPQYHDLVGSLPSSTFVEALHLLSPAYFIESYRSIHRRLHPAVVVGKRYKSLNAVFDEFTDNLARIVRIRRAAGHRLGLAEYTHLLDCARAMGDARMADIIWEDMEADEVIPDVRCYDHYMEAKIWENAYTGREKYRLRMTPYAYRKRRFREPAHGWEGYGTAGRSVRKEVLRIFKHMTERGIDGDETSFVNVILASSRVGHTRGIKNILKTVWNIDTDLLMKEADESKIPPVTDYDPSSALYPTDRLLFAVAHAFGTNSDIPAALRVVDFISRSYNVPVPEKVWNELFEWAFVLSRRRFGRDAARNAKGKIPWDMLTRLYKTMTSAPHNVRPTIEICHKLAKTAWDRCRLNEFQSHMRAGYEMLKETRQKRKAARLVVEEYLGRPFSSPAFEGGQGQLPVPDVSLLRSRGFMEAINSYDVLRLATAQQTLIIEKMARLLLIHHRWTGRDNPRWERVLLPRVIEEWQDFLPRSFTYNTRGGLVRFWGETKWGQRNIRPHQNIPIRRPPTTYEDGAPIEADKKEAEETPETDDDYLWDRYRQLLKEQNPDLDVHRLQPLNRLFWDVGETPFWERNLNIEEEGKT